MFGTVNYFLVYWCVFIVAEFCSLSVYGQQYPYPGVFYPPPPSVALTLPGYNQPPPFPFTIFPPYFGSQCYPGPIPDSPQIPAQFNGNGKSIGYLKPKIVKPFRVPGPNPVIFPNRGDSNRPIIISTRTSRTAQQPTLLSPLTNLIHTFLKSLAPRTCDCDDDGGNR